MNILLINLTRFGDLLQSQAAIRSLEQSAPALPGLPGVPDAPGLPHKQGQNISGPHRVALACLENFAHTTTLLRGLSAVFPLPGSSLLAPLGSSNASAWAEALAALHAWRQKLFNGFCPDLICNLTPSLPARLLARYLAAAKDTPLPITGFGVDEFGFGLNDSPWAAFLQAAARARAVSPFNVVDLFRAVAQNHGGGAPASKGQASNDQLTLFSAHDCALAAPAMELHQKMQTRLESLAAAALTTAELPALRGFVALQTGASEERRRWPLESFATAGAALWQEQGLLPVLLGGQGEIALESGYAAVAATPFVSLIGQTSLPELAAALTCCRLLISNDTGTMHLAAELEVPVLAIFLATAQPWDTGPYLDGSCAVEPDLPCHPCSFGATCPHDFLCRTAVSAELIRALALDFTQNGEFRDLKPHAHAGQGRVWRAEHDPHGFITLRALSDHADEPRTVWMLEQRQFLRQFLDRDLNQNFTPQESITGQAQALNLPQAEKDDLQADLRNIHALLGLLLEQGNMLLQNPLPPLRDKFLRNWQKINNIWESNHKLNALALLWREDSQREGALPETLHRMRQYLALTEWLLRRSA